jgi:PAS domain S-box-containing protein
MAAAISKTAKLNQIREELRTSERRFRALIEHSYDTVSLIAPDGTIFYASPSTRRVLGYTPDEFASRNTFDYVHPDDRKSADLMFSDIIERPGEPVIRQYRMRHRSGAWIWTESIATNLLDDPDIQSIVVSFRDITVRKSVEKEVRSTRERLEALSHRLMEVQESERRHLARELHDEVGQALTALKINVQTVQRAPDGRAAGSLMVESVELIDRLIMQVRNLSLDLRPSILDDLGLVVALRWYLDRVAQRSGFISHFSSDGIVGRLPTDIETACFRVAQEAITNIVRHAHAKNVHVSLTTSNGLVLLVVSDDGMGFDFDAVRSRAVQGASFGLLGMEERMTLIGGTLRIDSVPTRGTKLYASIPYFVPPSSFEGESIDEHTETLVG